MVLPQYHSINDLLIKQKLLTLKFALDSLTCLRNYFCHGHIGIESVPDTLERLFAEDGWNVKHCKRFDKLIQDIMFTLQSNHLYGTKEI